MVWLVGAGSILLIVFIVAGLYDLIRHRNTMEDYQVVLWGLFIVLIPLLGLVAYLFWRLSRSDAMLDAVDFYDENADGSGRLPTRGH